MVTLLITVFAVSLIAPFVWFDYCTFMQRQWDHETDDAHVSYRRDCYGTQHEYRRVAGGWLKVAEHKVIL